MTTEQQYAAQLKKALRGLPAQTRRTILDDVRAHFADAVERGRDVDETIAALGPPAQVAAAAREELGLPADTPTAQALHAGRLLQWAAVSLAVLTAVFVTFLLPMFTESTQTSVAGDTLEEEVYNTSTLFSQMGIAAGLLPLLPAILAVLPLVLRGRAAMVVGWTVAPLLTLAAVFSGFTLGGFYVPMVLLLWAALFVPVWLRGPRSRASALAWRTIGAIIILFPAVWLGLSVITGSLMVDGPAFAIAALVLVALGVLFALRVPYIDAILAACGLALMLLAVFDGGMLLLALWWAGGLWLLMGLIGVAARGSIR